MVYQYKRKYQTSRAIVIGINNYLLPKVSDLEFAANDAIEVKKILVDKFQFEEKNVVLLLNDNATSEKIMYHYLQWTRHQVYPDDRLVFFFAGHGLTLEARERQIGYLCPHNADTDDPSTLIRWDDLTKNAELIPAKHMLFLMDACYGGLAFQRFSKPGSMRYLRDMLRRYSRQVLTAGKADETVADSGGPLPNHSIFTGHLLKALQGSASGEDGLITAHSVMSYVYENVSKQEGSRQTPHFGNIEGDGEFIFQAEDDLFDQPLDTDEEQQEDRLVSIPVSVVPDSDINRDAVNEVVKEYLSEPKYKIHLHDFIVHEVRRSISEMNGSQFSLNDPLTNQEISTRFNSYECSIQTLLKVIITISYWGDSNHHENCLLVTRRITDTLELKSGNTVLQYMRWYPIQLICYAIGICAVAKGNYFLLRELLSTMVLKHRLPQKQELILSLGDSIVELERSNVYKQLPGFENRRTARSDYMLSFIQPIMEEQLYMGSDFEEYFDRFEVLLALVHADIMSRESQYVWGPIGRFVRRRRTMGESNMFDQIIKEAKVHKEDWEPLKAGFFNGNLERFEEVATSFKKEIIDNIPLL